MFLEGLQTEAENCLHRSSCAWFLWHSGGMDTCYHPLGDDCAADGGVVTTISAFMNCSVEFIEVM